MSTPLYVKGDSVIPTGPVNVSGTYFTNFSVTGYNNYLYYRFDGSTDNDFGLYVYNNYGTVFITCGNSGMVPYAFNQVINRFYSTEITDLVVHLYNYNFDTNLFYDYIGYVNGSNDRYEFILDDVGAVPSNQISNVSYCYVKYQMFIDYYGDAVVGNADYQLGYSEGYSVAKGELDVIVNNAVSEVESYYQRVISEDYVTYDSYNSLRSQKDAVIRQQQQTIDDLSGGVELSFANLLRTIIDYPVTMIKSIFTYDVTVEGGVVETHAIELFGINILDLILGFVAIALTFAIVGIVRKIWR